MGSMRKTSLNLYQLNFFPFLSQIVFQKRSVDQKNLAEAKPSIKSNFL